MAFALRFLRKKVSKLQMIDRLETINPKILRQSLKQILRKKDICKMSEHNTDKSNDVETLSKKVEVSERNTDKSDDNELRSEKSINSKTSEHNTGKFDDNETEPKPRIDKNIYI